MTIGFGIIGVGNIGTVHSCNRAGPIDRPQRLDLHA